MGETRRPAECWPPWVFVCEESVRRNWLPDQLRDRLGWTGREQADICAWGPLSARQADDLARVFETSPDYWLNLQASWDAYRASSPAERRGGE